MARGFVLQRQVALVPAGSHKNGSVQLCCDSLSSPAASLAHTAPPAPPRERDSAAIQSQCAQSPPLPEARSPTDCDCGPPAGNMAAIFGFARTSDEHYVYCSSLAIYYCTIKDASVVNVIAPYSRTITAFAANPHNAHEVRRCSSMLPPQMCWLRPARLIAVCGGPGFQVISVNMDKMMAIWNLVTSAQVRARHTTAQHSTYNVHQPNRSGRHSTRRSSGRRAISRRSWAVRTPTSCHSSSSGRASTKGSSSSQTMHK